MILLSEIDHGIIAALFAGKTLKEVAGDMDLHEQAVKYRVSLLRDQFSARTNCQLIFILAVNGICRVVRNVNIQKSGAVRLLHQRPENRN
jgi:hypothetical protein